VGGDHEAQAPGSELPHQAQDHLLVSRIEVGIRLIEEHIARLLGQGASDQC